ncbi:MAG TPA: heparinase II/III-family protein, partial [Kofleriaceae bacterium]|nr:heparinase II/III-family protein [Kofleriaceae bacterium]
RAAGQVVLRGPRVHATFDAGPFGFGTLAAHAHCDALALHVALDDRPLLVERGTYRYNGDRAARDRFRATAAHNTLQIGAREQGDIAGPFLWSRQPVVTLEHCALTAARDVVRASHDGFAPARHVRTVVRLGDTLAVIDEVRDPPAGEPIVARWHLAPGLAPAIEGDATRVAGVALWFATDDARPLTPRAITTAHSARYLAREPACTLEVTLPDPRRRLVTVIGGDTRDLPAVLGSLP